jgi:hypothetical protein
LHQRTKTAGEATDLRADAGPGAVVVYAPGEQAGPDNHESVTRFALGRRLAGLKGYAFAGAYEPTRRYACALYFVPRHTLIAADARQLGIGSERDLFGGVVPEAFAATKAITHPLLEADAYAPPGWSGEFARRVHAAVLSGFSAFTREDARRAGARLLAGGPVRFKPAREAGGHGQRVVGDAAALETALEAIDADQLAHDGVVLEQQLADATVWSIGQVRVAGLLATYCGTQRSTADNSGREAYGGSDLLVVRGDADALLRLDLSPGARLALAQARAYDAAAIACFPGFFASRRNYDVLHGLDGDGKPRAGVLEQSWRMGGASTAEVAALEAFRADPALAAVRACSVEIFGGSAAPPPRATVYFRGSDARAGAMTKYATVERYGDP